jgi:hypothetical protein
MSHEKQRGLFRPKILVSAAMAILAVSALLALIPMEGKPANKSTCNRSKFFVKSGCSPICFVIGYQEP